MEDKGIISKSMEGSFASIASAFVVESLEHMIPWLMVMFAVIVTDLCFGLRKSKLMGVKIRWSRAIRITMGKMVTYFAFVCMVCMLNTAMGNNYSIDKWACLLVCFIEGCSIIGNFLKPKGIDFNMLAAIRVATKKIIRADDTDINKIFKKNKSNEKNK